MRKGSLLNVGLKKKIAVNNKNIPVHKSKLFTIPGFILGIVLGIWFFSQSATFFGFIVQVLILALFFAACGWAIDNKKLILFVLLILLGLLSSSLFLFRAGIGPVDIPNENIFSGECFYHPVDYHYKEGNQVIWYGRITERCTYELAKEKCLQGKLRSFPFNGVHYFFNQDCEVEYAGCLYGVSIIKNWPINDPNYKNYRCN